MFTQKHHRCLFIPNEAHILYGIQAKMNGDPFLFIYTSKHQKYSICLKAKKSYFFLATFAIKDQEVNRYFEIGYWRIIIAPMQTSKSENIKLDGERRSKRTDAEVLYHWELQQHHLCVRETQHLYPYVQKTRKWRKNNKKKPIGTEKVYPDT